MRRALSLIVVLAASVLAGCGSAASTSSTPLATELSYFSNGSPFVMSIATAPGATGLGRLRSALGRSPSATVGVTALFSKLAQLGIDYNRDIKPLFGNPIAISVEAPSSQPLAATSVAVVWITKDAGALNRLVAKIHLARSGGHAGATLYRLGKGMLAIDGATLVAATTPAEVMTTLDRHTRGGGITASEYAADVQGLPQGAPVQAFGYLTQVLARPGTANARRIPWVAAVRAYAAAISGSPSGISFQYRLDTTGAPLTNAQLPLAPGASPPSFAGTLPIVVGLRDPASTLSWLLSVARISSPTKYAAELSRMAAVRRSTGVDFQRDVLGQLGNNAAVQSDGHLFMVRVDVASPARAAETLRRLGTSVLDEFGIHPGATVASAGDGFEVMHQAHHPALFFGVAGNEFVAGTVPPATLRAFAAAPATPAAGAHGAFAFRVGLSQLLRLAAKRLPPQLGQVILGSLGDITGWTAATPRGLTGIATLAIK
jgi:hypothetical protein